MFTFILRRFFHSLFVLFVVSFIVFFIMYKAGDPVELLLPPDATPQDAIELRHALGLDKPFWVQYKIFLKNAIHGNIGKSFIYGQPALEVVIERLPATLQLALVAIIISILLGIPLGVIAAVKPQAIISRGIMFFSLFGISIPVFWTGMVLVLIFSVNFEILPSSGIGDKFLSVDWLKHIILPAITLSLYQLALIIRLTRSGMMEVLLQDYIKLARAKGVPQRVIIFVHALKNTLIPVITVIGIQFGQLIAFASVTETIFAWPGTGKLIIDSIQNLDRPVVVAYLMVVSVIFIAINFIVDILYTFVDPRIRVK